MTPNIESRLEHIENLLDSLSESSRKPFNLESAAEYLGVSKSHLYQLTSQGRIAFFKPNGKRIYFDKADLDAYLLRNRRPAATEVEEATAENGRAIIDHEAPDERRFVAVRN